MTVLTISGVSDITGVSDNDRWYFHAPAPRAQADQSGIVTTREVPVKPVAGVLTVTLDPGPAVVRFPGGTFAFTVPTTDGELWPLIQSAVQIPPNTTQQVLEAAIAAYFTAHPVSGGPGGSSAWADITGKPAAVTALSGTNTGDQTIPTSLPPTDGSVTAAKINAATLVTAAETIAANNNDTTLPTSAAVSGAITSAVNGLLNGAPGALDTLKELADAINDDASFAASVTTALGGKVSRTSTPLQMYGTDGAGAQITGTYSDAATTNTLALRGTGGTLAVGDATLAGHAATKAQMDAADAAVLAAAQPLDADLTAIAALATTAFGRSLLTPTDAPSARITLGAYTPVQRYGSGVPSPGLGYDTDTYTDTVAAKRYTKTAGAWTVTTDASVSKEILLAGTWSTGAGTLSDDNSDGMTSKKIVTTTTGNHLVVYTLTTAVSMVNKVLRMPIRIDALSDWTGTIGIDISDTVNFTGRVTMMIVSSDTIRGGEVEAFTWAPNAGYLTGTPDLTAIKYTRINWTPQGGVARNAYMGQPVLIG